MSEGSVQRMDASGAELKPCRIVGHKSCGMIRLGIKRMESCSEFCLPGIHTMRIKFKWADPPANEMLHHLNHLDNE